MSDIEVVTEQLRRAATQIGTAADGVRGASPGDVLDPVGPALLDSASAGAASALSGAWRTRFTVWVSDARAQQQKLDASATTYDGTDGAVATGFAPPGRRAE